MGWSFRKSVGSGLFKVNFSRSGVSYSMGVRGARINLGPRGTYVNLNIHGINYRQKIAKPVYPPPYPGPAITPAEVNHNIASAEVETLTDTDSQVFINELNQKSKLVSYAKGAKLPLLLVVFAGLFVSFDKRERIIQPASDSTVVKVIGLNGTNIRKEPNKKSQILQAAEYGQKFTLLDTADPKWLKVALLDAPGYVSRELAEINHQSYPQVTEEEWYLKNEYLGYELVLCLVLFILLTRWLKKVDRKRLTTELHYDMDDKYQQVYEQFKAHFVTFSRSAKVWQYLNTQRTTDYKRNAGAGNIIRRVSIRGLSENKMPTPYFVTNVAIPCIALYNMDLYFLPERLLIKRGNTFAAVFYKNLRLQGRCTNFIESEILPADARVVDYTWQYVNRSGGPDRRFNNNRKLPVCAYSEYTFTSDTGIFEIIATSKQSAMDDFADFIIKIGMLQARMGGGYQ